MKLPQSLTPKILTRYWSKGHNKDRLGGKSLKISLSYFCVLYCVYWEISVSVNGMIVLIITPTIPSHLSNYSCVDANVVISTILPEMWQTWQQYFFCCDIQNQSRGGCCSRV